MGIRSSIVGPVFDCRRRSRRAAALAALLVATMAAAWPRITEAAAPGGLLPAVRIAVSSTPHATLLHLAAARGFFAAEGLTVTLLPVSHGKAALERLAKGEADLAAAAELPFVVGVLKGDPYGALASVASESGEMAVVARRDRGVAQPADLADKRIGVTQGTSGEYFLWAFLIRHRISPRAVSMVNLPPNQLAQAVGNGSVDAIATWQPVRRDAERSLGSQGVSFTSPDAYTVTHIVVGRQAFLAANAEAMRRVVRALLRAERFVREQPAQALAITAERLGISPADLQVQWAALELRVDQSQSQLITWEDEARWAMTQGYAERRPVPNLLPHLYLDALAAEAPDRVSVVR